MIFSRKYSYCIYLFVIFIFWFLYINYYQLWSLFGDWWPMSLTMAFGSLVAGGTPTGGAAVAFPVFTKILNISVDQSRTFGLMVQSFGMTAAAIFLWSRHTKILWRIVMYTCCGGFVGISLSSLFFDFPESYARALFTTMIATFAVAFLLTLRFRGYICCSFLARLKRLQKIEFFLIGIVGGIISDNTGSGVDIVLFIVLTLSYRVDEKVAVPTSVVVMAIASVYGFFWHGLYVVDTQPVMPYLLVCIPVVIVGAPLGAWLMCLCRRWQLVAFVMLLISAELVSTLLLLDFSKQLIAVMVVCCFICTLCFSHLLWRGRRRLLGGTGSLN